MRLLRFFGFCFLCGIIIASTSCKKEQFLTNGGELRFSADTLNFDTVFTTMGSFTLAVKLFNPQDQKINISSVRLEKGSNSFFNLNVNGIPGNNVTDLELAANDSIYVFATVNIDPNNDTIPFIVEDRLIATLNGKEYAIPFYAYGQNAHYLKDSVITQSDVWKTDKPYVILHSAAVGRNATLTIPAGCRIYMHADSRLFVAGQLKASGTKTDSIIFQGDRLDRGYFGNEGYPGEWGGIYFDSSSTGNIMEWCVLQNCGNSAGGTLPSAIQVVGKTGVAQQLTLKNTIIRNSIGYGLLSFEGNIEAENCLVHDCGAQALAVFQGGKCKFVNCDFINDRPKKVNHATEPTVAVLNYYPISDNQVIKGNLNIDFINCVIYGSLDNELYCDRVENAAISYNASFTNCLIKNKDGLASFVSAPASILNEDPLFQDSEKWNFRLKEGSPLIDNGTNLGVTFNNDLDNNIRNIPFDIGCYEFH